MITSAISIAGTCTNLKSSLSIKHFSLLKKFNISFHPPNATSIKYVLWHPSFINWTKSNIHGATIHVMAAYGGLFLNNDTNFVGAFTEQVRCNRHFLMSCLAGSGLSSYLIV
ncbi:hypothetical protein KIW84_061438 [Lathyrus oleraceus]|uniref:Uncharacterized protein n=1 Tax=Pisum sativum TaxID=3888 RepID=A0A9D5A4G5_PEA|nr:hypothetical protein KIW84_061438 [Pisum sativum]